MQLKYRGVSYFKSNSIPETSTQEISGVYRGVPWRKQPQNQRIEPRAIVQGKRILNLTQNMLQLDPTIF